MGKNNKRKLVTLSSFAEVLEGDYLKSDRERFSMGSVIGRHIRELNRVRTPEQMAAFLDIIQSEVHDKKYAKKMSDLVMEQKFETGYKMLYDIYLKSAGLSVESEKH